MKSKINCIAVDDEPIALLIIQQFCERLGGLDLTTYNEPRTGLEAIARRKPDLVFLDIAMNSISGLDIARTLPRDCCLIFTSAHAQYALDGFDLDAVDFLHKPFAYDRFERAVKKALRHIETRRNKPHHDKIIVKQEYNNITIRIADILYVEAMENYTKIFCKSGDHIIARTNLKSLGERLPKHEFIRIHRSYIIAVNQVRRFSKREIELNGKQTPIPIGRQYADSVHKTLVDFMPEE